MHVEELGSGPACLLLHGVPCTTAHLGPLARELAKDHRVLVPAYPGYGKSPAPTGPYRWSDVVEELAERVLSRSGPEVSVVGFSGGGYLALALALHPKLKVRKVALLAGLAGMAPEVRAAYDGLAAGVRAGTIDARNAWAIPAFAPGFTEKHPDKLEDVMGWVSAIPAGALADQLVALAQAEDLRPRLGEISAPVLARVGANDPVTPPAWAEEIARSVKNGRVEVVPGAGHFLLHEDAEASIASVARHLRG